MRVREIAQQLVDAGFAPIKGKDNVYQHAATGKKITIHQDGKEEASETLKKDAKDAVESVGGTWNI